MNFGDEQTGVKFPPNAQSADLQERTGPGCHGAGAPDKLCDYCRRRGGGGGGVRAGGRESRMAVEKQTKSFWCQRPWFSLTLCSHICTLNGQCSVC